MQINLRHPDIEQFIDEQVKTGRFKSADDVVATALARMMDEDIKLSDDDVRALNEADAEIDRGESEEFTEFAARIRKKHGIVG
jgi:putative addiction module CopG family antidote